jgi:hypothetical protein
MQNITNTYYSLMSEQSTNINMAQCCVTRHVLMVTMEKHFSQYRITSVGFILVNFIPFHTKKTEQLARDKPEYGHIFDIENYPSNAILHQLALLSWFTNRRSNGIFHQE